MDEPASRFRQIRTHPVEGSPSIEKISSKSNIWSRKFLGYVEFVPILC